jgi:hypothetical protein
MDVEGCGCGLLYGTIPASHMEEVRNFMKKLSVVAGLQNKA